MAGPERPSCVCLKGSLSMRSRLSTTVVTCAVVGTTALGTIAWVGAGAAGASPEGGQPPPPLTRVSHDPYKGAPAQHQTEAEPDTFAHRQTVVSVFQTGRFADGGSVDTGWATSKDGGATWKHGFLPGITTPEGGQWARVSDPAVAYDAKHHRWVVAGLVIDSNVNGRGVAVSGSKDGIHWDDPVIAAGNNNQGYDKEWIACDDSSTSPHYGNCYVEVDVTSSGNQVEMVTSSDGGKTWKAETHVAGAFGLGGQPLVQPDGTVVVPYSADFSAVRAFRSTNGGKSWTSPVTVSSSSDHAVVGMRQEPMPSAELDAKGKVYVIWDDCRFRSGCSSNDIVMSTSADGKTWSKVVRIPIDGVKSGRDHFTPGIGVSPTLSGRKTKLGVYYFYYPKANCSTADCRVFVGYINSADGGKTWSKPQKLAGPMTLSWLAQAGGAMLGDYISASVVGHGAVSVFPVGHPPHGTTKDQAMYSAGALPITGGNRPALSGGVRFTGQVSRSYPLPLN